MNSKPRLLLVEDDTLTWEGLHLLFAKPTEEYAAAYGVDGFDVDVATTGEVAQRLLTEAKDAHRPYDAMALDLGLPKTAGAQEDLNVGIDILRSADEAACAAIVVESVHTEVPTFIQLLRSRAADFISKPFEPEDLYLAVMRAYKAGLRSRWLRLAAQRSEEWRLHQAQAQVADLMGRAITNGLGNISDRAEELSRLIEDVYQLDPERDTDNPICRALDSLTEATRSTADECWRARKGFSPGSGEMAEIGLDAAIKRILDELRVGIAYRGLSVDGPGDGGHTVKTFPMAVEMILEEILFGAIEASGGNEELAIRVRRDDEEEVINIDVIDNGDPIDEAAFGDAKEGQPLTPKAGRTWGLSLAQRVAASIGAEITTGLTDSQTTVTLHIPLSSDD